MALITSDCAPFRFDRFMFLTKFLQVHTAPFFYMDCDPTIWP